MNPEKIYGTVHVTRDPTTGTFTVTFAPFKGGTGKMVARQFTTVEELTNFLDDLKIDDASIRALRDALEGGFTFPSIPLTADALRNHGLG